LIDGNQTISLLRMMRSPGIGPKTIYRILAALAKNGDPIASALDRRPSDLCEFLRVRARRLPDDFVRADEVVADVEALGEHVKVVPHTDERYPSLVRSRLKDDAPPILFLCGNPLLLEEPCVAVVGSRDASAEAIAYAGRVASSVREHRGCVVSGLARGVDQAAHSAASEVGGTTIGVLAEGILKAKITPEMIDLCESGDACVVSQFDPNARWAAHAAMTRNKLVVALARGVVVVAAAETGGTMDAGKTSLRLGVPLAVVSDEEMSCTSPGCELLAKEGADTIHKATLGPVIARFLDNKSNEQVPASQGSLF
jgi:Predicted Rossmann fold nucleotide-binding protein involved in DNA uptake